MRLFLSCVQFAKMRNSTVKLSEGEYTGVLKRIIETKHFIVSTTNYMVSQCNSTFHNHKNPHICLLIQGSDLECKKDMIPYQRVTGDLFYYEAGENHKTISTLKDSKNVNVEFKTDTLKRAEIPFQLNFDLNNKNPIPKFLVLNMLHELLTNDSTSPESLETMAFQLFKINNGNYYDTKPNWVLQMDEYLHEHWANDFSLIDLANAVGTHPVTISKNFKKYYNCTYGEYRRMLKIHNSITLIKNHTMPLTKIAHACGFSDQSHFIRNFKKYVAFRPKDFRRI